MSEKLKKFSETHAEQGFYAMIYGFLQSVAPRRTGMLSVDFEHFTPEQWLTLARTYAKSEDNDELLHFLDEIKELIDQEKYDRAYDLLLTKYD
jgi:hypothetical protein